MRAPHGAGASAQGASARTHAPDAQLGGQQGAAAAASCAARARHTGAAPHAHAPLLHPASRLYINVFNGRPSTWTKELSKAEVGAPAPAPAATMHATPGTSASTVLLPACPQANATPLQYLQNPDHHVVACQKVRCAAPPCCAAHPSPCKPVRECARASCCRPALTRTNMFLALCLCRCLDSLRCLMRLARCMQRRTAMPITEQLRPRTVLVLRA